MSTSMRFPGRNTVTLCEAALMEVVEQAMNERTYGSDKVLVRVLGVSPRADGGSTLFDVQVTTDPPEGAAKVMP